MIQLSKGQFVDFIARPAERLEVPMPSCWYVLRSHPGKERKVIDTLRRDDVSYYYPTFRHSQIVRRVRFGYEVCARREVVSPLFPGMIFIPDFEISTTNFDCITGSAGFLRFGPTFARLRAQDHRDICAIVATANTPPRKRKRLYAVGQLVRVVDGPFAGFEGRIERLDSRRRLSVLIDVFKRATPSELEEGQIEPV